MLFVGLTIALVATVVWFRRRRATKGKFRQLSSYEVGETLNESFVDDLSDYDYDLSEEEEEDVFSKENLHERATEAGGVGGRALPPVSPSNQILSDSSTEA